MRYRRSIPFLAGALAVAQAAPPAPAQQRTPPGEAIEARRAWVEQVEAEDYLFWRRYLDRLDRKGREFPQQTSWYHLVEIVEGGEAAALPRLSPPERTIAPAAIAEAARYAMARKTGALLVARHGRIEFESYGEGLGPTSLLTSRSLAKGVLAAVYGPAIARGHIGSLDDAIGAYLVEWRDDPRGRITIRQLLGFTSGLENIGLADLDPDSKAMRLVEGSAVNAAALRYQYAGPPDRVVAVNNADSQLAGLVLERATGRRYAQLLSDWLWRPIGAGAATLNLDDIGGDARLFCCMQARAVDWLRFGLLLQASGRWGQDQVIPRAHLARMIDGGPVNPLVGLGVLQGWDVADPLDQRRFAIVPQAEPFASAGTYYLLGGRSIALWIVPEYDMVVFRWGEDVADWDNSFIVNTLIRGIETR